MFILTSLVKTYSDSAEMLAPQGAVIFSSASLFLNLFEDERLERCMYARETFLFPPTLRFYKMTVGCF
jgi:uncharacterized protein (DUF4213/DUF364 family)